MTEIGLADIIQTGLTKQQMKKQLLANRSNVRKQLEELVKTMAWAEARREVCVDLQYSETRTVEFGQILWRACRLVREQRGA